MKLVIKSYARIVTALLFSPLLALGLVPLGGCMVNLSIPQARCLANIDGFIIFGAIPVAIAMLIFGVPLTLISIRLGFVRAWQYFLGGAFVGVVIAFTFALFESNVSIAGVSVIAGIVGATTAILLWLIGIRSNLSAAEPIDHGVENP